MIDHLYDYQRQCVNNAIDHLKKSLEPQLLVLPTAAGKSHINAEIAKLFFEMSGKKTLCLASRGLLVEQNSEKYMEHGLPASIFADSLKKKSLRHNTVFGMPKTVWNAIERVKKESFGLVIVDEAHEVTPTLKNIINKLREHNSALRIIGLSATPFRRGSGYIYESHYKLGFMDECIDPYYKKCTFEISGKELLNRGYITRPIIGKTALRYETENLALKNGKFSEESIHQVFDGRGRLTAEIVKDVVETAAPYAGGVLFFCATIQHTQEVLESLPPEHAAMTVGDQKLQSKEERRRVEKAFKEGKLRYLANVGTQTTGSDFKQCVVIALLRRSESVSLLMQMIGRGMRKYPGKEFFLVLDYADNMATHFPSGDIFQPVIKAKKKGESERIPVICPECNHENQFAIKDDVGNYGINENGYLYWKDTGDLVKDDEGNPIAGHKGQRCNGIVKRTDRCNFRWIHKTCAYEGCEEILAMSARYCPKGHENIDPNDKLFLKGAKQGSIMSEPIVTMEFLKFPDYLSKKDVVVHTALGKKIRVFVNTKNADKRDLYRQLRDVIGAGPKEIPEGVYPVESNICIEFKKSTKNPLYNDFVGISDAMPWS